MMPTEVIMPQIGETVVSGTIVKWLKEVGDHVAADESLVEIATDKATVEIPSPAAGVLQKKLAEEGEEVKVGGLLAIIIALGEKVEEVPKPSPKAAEPQAPPKAAEAEIAPPRPEKKKTPPVAEAKVEEKAVEAEKPVTEEAAELEEAGAGVVSPAERRLKK
ncbi:MAG: hypothetical protein HY801_09590 [Candidatus Lindowbacteria bacterium]|nr:hypothetical protein [Candidatus Lindowbacteria bacterium]